MRDVSREIGGNGATFCIGQQFVLASPSAASPPTMGKVSPPRPAESQQKSTSCRPYFRFCRPAQTPTPMKGSRRHPVLWRAVRTMPSTSRVPPIPRAAPVSAKDRGAPGVGDSCIRLQPPLFPSPLLDSAPLPRYVPRLASLHGGSRAACLFTLASNLTAGANTYQASPTRKRHAGGVIGWWPGRGATCTGTPSPASHAAPRHRFFGMRHGARRVSPTLPVGRSIGPRNAVGHPTMCSGTPGHIGYAVSRGARSVREAELSPFRSSRGPALGRISELQGRALPAGQTTQTRNQPG